MMPPTPGLPELDTPISPGNVPQLPRRIPSLDGLRALSILTVLIGHGAHTLPRAMAENPAMRILGNGRLGVTIFFIISGFLITRLLLDELSRSGTISLRGFYFRRAFRILPAFYALILGTAALDWIGYFDIPPSQYICSALFIQNYNFWSAGWHLGHLWSLSVEEQFYLIWPTVLAVLRPRRAAILALAILVASPVLRVAWYFAFPNARGYIVNMTHTRADTLMFGCLAAIWYHEPWFDRFIQRCLSWKLHYISVAWVCLGDPILESQFRGAWKLPFGFTLEGFCGILIIVYAIRHSSSPIGRLLNSRPFVVMGTLSFSLYLWNQLFFTPQPFSMACQFPWNIPVVFGAAVLSYQLVERPLLALRSRLSKGSPRE